MVVGRVDSTVEGDDQSKIEVLAEVGVEVGMNVYMKYETRLVA